MLSQNGMPMQVFQSTMPQRTLSDVQMLMCSCPQSEHISQTLGLVDSDISIVENYICLCTACKTSFDDEISPGFTFFPKDLDYFVDYELQDRQRRFHDKDIPRRVPTSEAYLQHMKDTEQVGQDTEEPPYICYILGKNDTDKEVEGIKIEKEWHGAPLAAIRRAWMALGTPRDNYIPTTYRRKLFKLLELYRVEPH